MNLNAITLAITRPGGVRSWDPLAMFTGTTTGAWYDPSDYSTLYQNAAGTLPVTAVEQPVGRMLDKSGRGNHAFNGSGNSANFPVLSARYNLLTKTEQFDDAGAWVYAAGSSIDPNTTAAPDGQTTADTLKATSNATLTVVRVASKTLTKTASAIRYTSVYHVKKKDVRYVAVGMGDGVANGTNCVFDLDNNCAFVSTKNDGTGFGSPAYQVDALTNGWYRIYLTATSNTATAIDTGCTFSKTANFTSASYLAGEGGYIWGADLRVANDALNQPAYQRVNTSTDYDTVGFKPYLRFNGTNQWLQTNSIDFTYGDKMFVCAGVRKLSDANVAAIATFSSGIPSINGAFGFEAPGGANMPIYSVGYAASQFAYQNISTFSAPTTNVLSISLDISQSGVSNEVKFRANASVPTVYSQSANDGGTGNYGNYPLYIGARAGSSLWFNGRLYGLIVAGKLANAVEITETEKYVNGKTAAY